MRDFSSRSHRSSHLTVVGLVTLALLINGPMATGMSMTDTPEPEASASAEPTPEVTAAESEATEEAAAEADAVETDATEEPAAETPAADADPSESASADGDQAPMVDPVEDTDDSATTGEQAPMVDPVEEADESASGATEESSPAEEATSVPADATDGAPVEEFVPGIKVIPGDQSATIYWPDFGAEKNYVIQFEQADGTWKTVEKDVVAADLSSVEGPVALVDNQATVEDLKDGKNYTARIVSANTLAEAASATEDAVDLTPGGPRGSLAIAGLRTADFVVPAASPPFRVGTNYAPSKENPVLNAKCGLDFALVLDSSGSIGDTGITNLKTAANAFVESLVDTGSYVSQVSFSTSSPGRFLPNSGGNLGPLALTSANLTTVKDSYKNLDSNGTTNWEDGLLKSQARFGFPAPGPGTVTGAPDMVIVITDGNPNTYNLSNGTPSSNVGDGDPRAVNPAIAVANQMKTAGVHMFGIAVGGNITIGPIQAITNQTELLANGSNFTTAGYTRTTNYATLANLLKEIAVELCAPSVTVTKLAQTPGSPLYTSAGGWTFEAGVKIVDGGGNWVNPGTDAITANIESIKTQVTDQGGAANFQWEPSGAFSSTLRLRETQQPAFERVPELVCKVKDLVTGSEVIRTPTPDSEGWWNVGTIGARQIVTCTAKNSLKPKLTLVKKVEPVGTAPVSDWILSAVGPTSISGITGAPAVTRASVPVGTYVLSELPNPGANFTASLWTCKDTAANNAPVAVTQGSVSVGYAQEVTCEITNARNTAQLKLVKKVDPAGSADVTQWKLSALAAAPLDGKNIVDAAGGTGTFRSVFSATDYTLSESGSVANFTNGTSWTCVNAQGAPVTVTSNKVQVPAGGQVTCEITNARNTAQLKLVKKVDPAGSADVTQWKLSALAAAPLDGKNIVDAAGGTGTFRSVFSATDYTLSESGSVANFTNGTSWTCVNAQGAPVTVTSNKVQVPAGGQVTCEITNARNTAQLKLVKKVDPAGSADVTQWKLSALAAAPLDGKNIVDAAGGTGTFRSVFSATDYTLSESGSVTNFTNGTSWTCVNAQGAPVTVTSNKVQVPAGGQVTCEITNTRNTAQLKLVKKVDPAGSADVTQWKLSALAAAPLDGKNIVDAAGGTGTFRSVFSATDYTLSESGSVTNFTNGTSWTCVNAQGAPVTVTSNKVQVPAGGQVTCEITNTRNTAQLKLVKKVDPAGSADVTQWKLSALAAAPLDGKNIVDAAGGTGTFRSVFSATDYTLSESGSVTNFTNGTSWTCVNAQGAPVTVTSNKVQVPAGGQVTCEITNTRNTAQLKLVKKVVGVNPADPDLWDLSAVGPQGASTVENKGGSGVLTEVWSGVVYTLAESAGAANYSPSDWSCQSSEQPEKAGDEASDAQGDGGFVLEGDTVTLTSGASIVCTITNTRDTAELKLQKAWVNARGGDTAALTIKGGLPDSGAPTQTSTATGATGKVLDTTNVANATVQVGDTVTVTEILGASNAGKYGSTLACTAGDVTVKVDDKGEFKMPDAAVTCTFTNDRSVVVPTQPTVTAEICDPNIPGAQLPGSITIPANFDYAYFIDGVAAAAGTYPKPAGSYKVAAQLIVTKPVPASSLQQLAAQDVYTWTVVVPGSPVCPLLVKESTPGAGQPVVTGQTVGYTITAKNGGDTAVVGETLVDTLPAGVDLITSSINPSNGVYNATARTITWKFDLPAAVGTTPATAAFTYQVTVTASSGSIVNSVSWVERSLTATTSNTVEPAVVGGVEETPDEPDAVVGGTEDLPDTGAGNELNVAGFGLLAMLLGGLMVAFGRRRRREQ